ncbi:hypothetical protein [Taibaiella koreensis]|uniref:hypothetical protein n=1 Tax=Taibaiella koreensis TaxID=1268548 RepID=UPI000E59BF30|nr:hypothetical protein [Taibaiella koreensis]
MKEVFRFLIFLSLVHNVNAQTKTQYCIDFDKFLNISPDPFCSYYVSEIPFKLYQINDDPMCSNLPTTSSVVRWARFNLTSLPNYKNIVSLRFTVIKDNKFGAQPDAGADACCLLVGTSSGQDKFYLKKGESFEIPVKETDVIIIADPEMYLINPPGSSTRYPSGPIPNPILNFSPVYRNSNGQCHDPSIDRVENLLSQEQVLYDSTRVHSRAYHFYQVDTIVCDPHTPPSHKLCNADAVWDFIKSRDYYQAPLYSDFPSLSVPNTDCDMTYDFPFKGISKAFELLNSVRAPGPLGNTITDCEQINLSPTPARWLLGVVDGPTHNILPYYTNSDPVKIVIDEENKCITNYTLPGHFLYPGKIKRCIVGGGECDRVVRVTTEGSGFSGWDSALGYPFSPWISMLNICVGTRTFSNLNARLVYDFNNK